VAAVITYRVRQAGLRSWLVRGQRSSGLEDFEEPVCPAVLRIALDLPRDPKSGPDDWQALPVSASVSIVFEAGGPSQTATAVLVRTGVMP
jgi:hypothetical protein